MKYYLPSMWKGLGQSLSMKQAAGVVLVVAAAAGAVFETDRAIESLWHRHQLQRSIPAALEGIRRQRAVMEELLEGYRRHFGCYPPMFTAATPDRGVINPLCYEMLGVRFNSHTKAFYLPASKDGLSLEEAGKYFNVKWFTNCLSFPNLPTNFTSSHSLPIAPMTQDGELLGIGVNYTDCISQDFWDDYKLTPWRYAVNPAIHNPGKYDLWVEVNVAGKHYTIGNWPEVR